MAEKGVEEQVKVYPVYLSLSKHLTYSLCIHSDES